ncbi:MAG: peroxiredoxin [Alphaproteobacteria bacterium]|jgi:peroxiredoxin Q/BCP|nr:peroxiredoxin [Alphaproteobacteria bacterium]MDP6515524.1 peroxiredoxin [Alphaproteobacteria bacterium]
MAREIKVGARAPDFDLPADGDERLGLGAFKGQSVVLYFYPKDDTAGCTKEAIGFTAARDQFAKIGAAVVGVSRDSVKTHEKFIKKHDLGVRLVADEDDALCRKYGVWVEKSMYGRKYMGIERATYLIDAKGVVRNIWRKVKVPGHVEAVLEAATAL